MFPPLLPFSRECLFPSDLVRITPGLWRCWQDPSQVFIQDLRDVGVATILQYRAVRQPQMLTTNTEGSGNTRLTLVRGLQVGR